MLVPVFPALQLVAKDSTRVARYVVWMHCEVTVPHYIQNFERNPSSLFNFEAQIGRIDSILNPDIF